MGKIHNQNDLREHGGLRLFTVVALTLALATFGCSTNRYPGTGEPMTTAPSGGSIAPSSTSTPGSSGGTATIEGMVPSSVDAIAILRANEGFRGKVLGPANPGSAAIGMSMQQVTGQFVSPSLYANPQSTVNTSISSDANPVISTGLEGVAVTGGGGIVTTAGTAAAATLTPTGAIGLSDTTATSALTTTGNALIGTGVANGIAAASNVVATPTFGVTGLGTARVATATTTRGALAPRAALTNRGLTVTTTAPVRIQTSRTGAVTVTNVTAAQTATTARGNVRVGVTTNSATTGSTTP